MSRLHPKGERSGSVDPASAVEPGWTAVLSSPSWYQRAAATVAIVQTVLVGVVWILCQHSKGPVVSLMGSLLGTVTGGREDDDLGHLISYLGTGFYVDYLRFVALPVVLGGCAFLPFAWYFLLREASAERIPEAIYFYPDRILLVGRRERLTFPLADEDGEGSEAGAPLSLWKKVRRELRVQLRWWFEWSSGKLGGTMPPAPLGWRLRTATGEPIRPRRFFLNARFRRCPNLRKAPGWPFLREVLRSLPMATAFVFFLLAGAFAGTYAWLPLFLVAKESPASLNETEALAEEAVHLRTGLLFRALTLEGETTDDYVRVLGKYLAAGGDALYLRAEQALVELGRGRPRHGLAWLAPHGEFRGLELRLAVATGDHETMRQAASQLDDSASSNNSRAAVHLLVGEDDEARRLLDLRVERPRSIVFAAALARMLGDGTAAVELTGREEVAAWLASEVPDHVPSTPFDVHVRVRELVHRALAAQLLGDGSAAADHWQAAQQLAAGSGLPHLLDGFYRFLWNGVSGTHRIPAQAAVRSTTTAVP